MTRSVRGLALIELLVAIALMGMVIFFLGAYYPLASLTATRGRDRTAAAHLAAQRLEQIRGRPFTWLTQLNVNTQFNFVPGNPNCPLTSTEILTATGACYGPADEGPQYTRITTVTTTYAGDPRLTKVLVRTEWPEGSAVDFMEMATILTDFP